MSRKLTPAGRFRLFSCSLARPSRLSLLPLLLTTLAAPRLRAQDPSQIMQQLTDLQQQMAGATDPCPFMPKLRSLIQQIANQSPDVYNAMKPSLDLLNSEDDGCKTDSATVSPAPASTIADSSPGAASNVGTAEMQTLGAVSGDTTPIQPLAPAVLSQTQPTLPQPTPNAVASTPQKAQSGFTYQVSHGQPKSKTVASNTGTTPPAANSQPRANPNPGGVPSGVSTGTAPPANCVYLSPSQPCVPLAQWQQMQANQPIRVPVEVCPKSGFVPGLMRKVSSDVSEGVPCTPGQPIDPSVFASGSSSVSNSSSFGGSSGSSTSGGGNSSGSGVSNTGGPSDPILNDCIGLSYKNDPITGDHLIIQNNCSIRAQVYFYASSQVSGGEVLDPGEAGNTYAAHDKILAAGGVSIYACPVGDVPRQADGTLAYNGVNNHFLCSRK